MSVMEEKKRGFPEPTSEDRDHKKIQLDDSTQVPLSAIEDDGPTGPMTQQDVVNFQKEAIFRRMQTYKRDYELESDQLDKLKKQYDSLQKCFSILDIWWDQLIDVLAPGSSSTGAIPETLLHFALEESEEEPSSSDFAKALEKKKSLVTNKLGVVFKSSKSAEIKDMEASLADLSAKYHKARAENEGSRQEKQQFLKQLESVTAKYRDAAHNLDRLQSSTVKRILKQETANGSVKSESPLTGNDDTNENDKKHNDSGTSSEEYQKVVTELESTKSLLQESSALVKKLSQQLEGQEKTILDLHRKVREWSGRLANPSEGDLAGSDVYQQIQHRCNDLVSRNTRLSTLNDRLRVECGDLVAAREAFETSIKEKYAAKEKDLEHQVNKAEQDVARIRAARDDLLSELNIKKVSEHDKVKSFQQLNDLVKVREERIKTLEEEVKMFRGETNSETTAINLEEIGSDELKQLVEKLQRQNKNLSAEIPGLEAAFAKAHAKATAKVYDTIEVESKLTKLAAEKVKADEKYFAAMRSKDAVNNECQKLKTQLAKSAETMALLKEGERAKSSKVANLDRQIQEMRNHLHGLEKDLEASKLKVTEREIRADSAYRQLDSLRRDLDVRDADVSKAVQARRGLETEVEKLKVQLEAKKFSSVGSGSSSEVQEQLDALRSIAMCSLCSKNWKNTCIKVCGHVFCYECAEDRLKARLRKCPNCNKQYSYNDLLSIHL